MKDEKPENTAGVTEKKLSAGRMKRRDWIIAGVLTIVAALMTFIGLGSPTAPVRYYETKAGNDYIIFDKGVDEIPRELYIYLEGTSQSVGAQINVYQRSTADRGSDDTGFKQVSLMNVEKTSGFKWVRLSISDALLEHAPDLKLVFSSPNMRIGEIVLIGSDGGRIELDAVYGAKYDKQNYEALTDEQEMLVKAQSPFYSMYGFENKYAEAAFQLASGNPVTMTGHPPLGVELIALGIKIFGMTPFGWRFITALCAALIPGAMYLLAKRIFKKSYLAAVAGGLTLVCGLFTTLGRMANIDVFFVLFLLFSLYFFYRFYTDGFVKSERKDFVRQLIFLGLSGFFFSLMLAVKWSALFFVILPAVLFVLYMVRSAKEFKGAQRASGSAKQAVLNENARQYAAKRNAVYLVAAASYVLFAAVVYLISYIPTAVVGFSYETARVAYFPHIFGNISKMLSYHTGSVAGAGYPALWLIGMGGSKLFSIGYQTVYLTATPILVYFGLAAGIWAAVSWVKGGTSKLYKNNMRMLSVIALGIGATLLPWLFFFRGTDMGNFYPALLFLILLVTLAVKNLNVKLKFRLFSVRGVAVTTGHAVIFAGLLLLALCFGLYVPAYYGLTVSETFFKGMYFFL